MHHSPAWADRREEDEYLEDGFWRACFLACLLEGGDVSSPPDLAEDFHEQQEPAARQSSASAAGLPDEALTGFREP